jgi:ADP-heptose:LPS heptosyltransferase
MNTNSIKALDYYIGYMLILALWPISFLINLLLKALPKTVFNKNIVFIKIVGGGSLLIAAPSIYEIKKKYPAYKIKLFCSMSVVPFAKTLKIFDEIHAVSLDNPLTFLASFISYFYRIIFSEYVINLEIYSKLASLITLYTMSKNRIGLYPNFNHWQSHLINQPIFISNRHPVYESYANIAHTLGCHNISFLKFKEYFKLSHKIKLRTDKKYIVLAPFCSDIYKERELNPHQLNSIILNLHLPKNTQFILIGGKNDLDKATSLERILLKNNYAIKNNVGKTSLLEVMDFLNQAKLLITIDSGILHLARLTGTKTFSYWGPSDPATRLFEKSELDQTIYNRISCSPCVHSLDKAPCYGNNLCMKQYFETIPKDIFWHIR